LGTLHVTAIDAMAWSFVSPASRGIGFALTRHLLQTTKAPVFVTSRTDIAGTKKSILANLDGVDSSRLTVVELDVTGKCLSAFKGNDFSARFLCGKAS